MYPSKNFKCIIKSSKKLCFIQLLISNKKIQKFRVKPKNLMTNVSMVQKLKPVDSELHNFFWF